MRQKNNLTSNNNSLWIFGKHPVFLALQKKRREIFQILATKNSIDELLQFLEKNKLFAAKNKIKIVDLVAIAKISGPSPNQGLALNCSYLPLKSENVLLDEIAEKKSPLLILDQLNDPHNVGAIIRSACAFGFTKIVFPEHNFVKETATINKSSSGMIENVDLYLIGNLNNFLQKIKERDYWCVGLAGEGAVEISEAKKFENIALIVGSEGEGIRKLVKQNCDLLVKIPISSEVESLNASVAAAIAMYELKKLDN